MEPNELHAIASIPLADIKSYQALRQTRHGDAPIYNLSLAAISAMPPLPAVAWATIGQQAPTPIDNSGYVKDQPLPKADVVVITWTGAEWAALDHVFCDSAGPMSYNAVADKKSWSSKWLLYTKDFNTVIGDLTKESPSLFDKAWGKFIMVTVKGKRVLLFKADMHISTDGPKLPLTQMVSQILEDCQPELVLTTGTAGGARPVDNLGTVNVTNGGHFLLASGFQKEPFNGQTFSDSWTLPVGTFTQLDGLLMQTPVTEGHLTDLLDKLNDAEKSTYKLADVSNTNIAPDAIPPEVNILDIPVLTTNSYVVGNTSGNFAQYAAMEMDDAVVCMQAKAANVTFGVLRNISDPVMNATLPQRIQQSWGGSIYTAYGIYTTYNSALAAWASI